MTTQFRESIETALHNPNLTGALGRFSEAYRISRAKAYEGIDFEAVRDQIVEIKGSASSNFEALAEQFKASAEARGAKVFRTADPAQVKQYILALAKEKGVQRVVKSKSMASEEIHLNKAFEQAGIEVDETDLGEWIIQLAHQTPSHMVMPAIHMTKEEVTEVFNNEVEPGQVPDIAKLVKFARAKLRPMFLQADMGISGANIAVAETGSLVIVTNEGNARLVTTLPRIHVAIVGIEKLVEHFSDIQPILRALPKSATAQLLTSYVSIITGQVPNTDGTPKELHIILMDNRRTEMSQDPKFKQAIATLYANGTMQKILAKWGLTQFALPNPPKATGTGAPGNGSGTVTFCSDTTYPPMETLVNGKASGADIDIADAIAKLWGDKADIKSTGFDVIIPALQGNKCDAIISALTDSAERAKSVDFADYVNVGMLLMVKKGNPSGITDGLSTLAGKTVAVEAATTEKQMLDQENAKLAKGGK